MNRKEQAIYWASTFYDALWSRKGYYVLGYPKSGTNWLCHLLSDYFEIPILEPWTYKKPTTDTRIFHIHRILPIRSLVPRTCYLVRDGRDAVVSRYFSAVNEPGQAGYLDTAEQAIGAKMTAENVRDALPGFIGFLAGDRKSSVDYRTHVHAALARGYFMMKYEDMLRDDEEELSRAVKFLTGKEADPGRIKAAAEKNRFAVVKKKDPDEPFLRSGKSGDWRNHFSRQAAEAFDRYAGEILLELGYEKDRNWVDGVR